SRMGGVTKGLLRHGSQTIIERQLGVIQSALGSEARVCLVGESAAYAATKLASVSDDPSGIGPLGGLRALMIAARNSSATRVFALACDMPYLETSLLQRLASFAQE